MSAPLTFLGGAIVAWVAVRAATAAFVPAPLAAIVARRRPRPCSTRWAAHCRAHQPTPAPIHPDTARHRLATTPRFLAIRLQAMHPPLTQSRRRLNQP